MKSNIEKVYSKLPKTELTTQKVELGVVDDISNGIKRGNTILKVLQSTSKELKELDKKLVQTIKSAVKEASKEKSKAEKLKKTAEKQAQGMFGVLSKAQNAADDLGVGATSIEGFLELERLALDIDDEATEDFVFTDLAPLVR